ncbi:MAG TPA: hypothetical protein DHN29_17765, partial [Cytophagales bacterium]|nr:hypothetical protein [Cytophagales bacterium]
EDVVASLEKDKEDILDAARDALAAGDPTSDFQDDIDDINDQIIAIQGGIKSGGEIIPGTEPDDDDNAETEPDETQHSVFNSVLDFVVTSEDRENIAGAGEGGGDRGDVNGDGGGEDVVASLEENKKEILDAAREALDNLIEGKNRGEDVSEIQNQLDSLQDQINSIDNQIIAEQGGVIDVRTDVIIPGTEPDDDGVDSDPWSSGATDSGDTVWVNEDTGVIWVLDGDTWSVYAPIFEDLPGANDLTVEEAEALAEEAGLESPSLLSGFDDDGVVDDGECPEDDLECLARAANIPNCGAEGQRCCFAEPSCNPDLGLTCRDMEFGQSCVRSLFPEVSVTSIDFTPSNPQINDQITFTATIQNIGAPTDDYTVSFSMDCVSGYSGGGNALAFGTTNNAVLRP